MFKALLLTGTFLLKISYMTLTSLQQVFNPCPPTGSVSYTHLTLPTICSV